MGSKTDNSEQLLAQSREASENARQALESVQLPDIEDLRIALQSPELVGLLEEEVLADSEESAHKDFTIIDILIIKNIM